VIDYIQKPIDPQALHIAVSRATGKFLRVDSQPRLSGGGTGVFTKPPQEARGVAFLLVVANLKQMIEKQFVSSDDLFRYFLKDQLQTAFPGIRYSFPSYARTYAAFCFIQDGTGEEAAPEITRLLERLEQQHLSAWAVWVSCGSGEAEASCQHLEAALPYLNLSDRARCVRLESIRRETPAFPDQSLWIRQLIACAEFGGQTHIVSMVDGIVSSFERTDPLTVAMIQHLLSSLRSAMDSYFLLDSLAVSCQSDFRDACPLCDMLQPGNIRNWLIQYVSTLAQTNPTPSYPEGFRELLIYIQENYSQNLTLQTLSELFYFHPSTISKLFVKYLKTNFTRYVNDVRLKNAAVLLLGDKVKITVVSERAGFDSASYFCRQFKRKYHCSPQDYKSLHQVKE
jgi:AraC-like DNA-binding protein